MEETEIEKYQRSIEDVKSIIKHAKLEEKDLTQITQAIYYPDEEAINNTNNLKLLQLDKNLLQNIQNGQQIQFKGSNNEKCVLCTDDKTYELKIAEISNSLLLIPNLKFAQSTSKTPLLVKSPNNSFDNNSSIEDNDNSLNNNDSTDKNDNDSTERVLENKNVLKIFHEYFECREIKPRYRKLYDLLQYTRYSGPENEYCIDKKNLFTFNQLLDTIQCSRKEFFVGLRKYRAIEIDGYIRVLEIEYEYRIVNLMLGIISENSWELNEIDYNVTINLLNGIAPKDIVSKLFELYTICNENNSKFHYNEEMVCRLVAQNILQPGLKFHIEEFVQTWQEALPEGIIVGENYLRGLGIIDRDSPVQCVKSLFEENLPTNLHDRLRIVFKTKSKWTLEEIEPYIEYFSTPNSPCTVILSKYARSVTINGQRYYTAKHT